MAKLQQLVNFLCAPAEWESMSLGNEMQLVELRRKSAEFHRIKSHIRSTLGVTIGSIERIQNPHLLGCYLFKKEEYKHRGVRPKEKDLFHCTSAENVESIAWDNLDWRRTTRSKFGRGVSFSPSAWYANRYANYNIGSERALILCKVLVGRTKYGKSRMLVPPEGIDTCLGNGNKVYVKFNDYEYYPMYAAYYSDSTYEAENVQDAACADDDDYYGGGGYEDNGDRGGEEYYCEEEDAEEEYYEEEEEYCEEENYEEEYYEEEEYCEEGEGVEEEGEEGEEEGEEEQEEEGEEEEEEEGGEEEEGEEEGEEEYCEEDGYYEGEQGASGTYAYNNDHQGYYY